jgi:hypothetical protein
MLILETDVVSMCCICGYHSISLIAAAIILKLDSGWSWFITLSDYPRITQDGI